MSWIADHPKGKISELVPVTIDKLKRNGISIYPKHFYVHGYIYDRLEEHKVGAGYDFFNKWNEWLLDGRIYEEKKKLTIEESSLV